MPSRTESQHGQNTTNREQVSSPLQSAQGGARNNTMRFEFSNHPAQRDSRNDTAGLHLDRNPDTPSANTFRPRSGPYSTPWFSSAETLWSTSLIEQGRFSKPDTVLLAFIVDCAMKLYICAGINLPCLENLTASGIVHTIIQAVYSTVFRQIQRPDLMSQQALGFGRFYLTAVVDFEKIRERCDITFGQHIQDRETRNAFAVRFLIYDGFGDDDLGTISDAFEWVYGQSPSSIVNDIEEIVTEDSARDLISIRKWVFEFN